MLCGTAEIGKATAEKMKSFRLVVWAMHGIYGAGKTLDETFGLIETVEKAAQIYMLTAHLPALTPSRMRIWSSSSISSASTTAKISSTFDKIAQMC